jgi:hypothetical protein
MNKTPKQKVRASLVVAAAIAGLVAPAITPTTGAAAEPPNLVVASIGAVTAKDGDRVTFSTTVKNIGGSATPAGVIHGVRFTVDGAAITWSDSSTASLAPGATRTLTANGGPSGSTWPATAGPHTVEAWVDDVNRIVEGNESDNKLGLPFQVASAGPANLVVVSIGAVTAKAGDRVTFSTTIKNTGGLATPAGVIHGVRFTVDGAAITWSDSSTASLAPGATRTLTANGGPSGSTWPATAGPHTVEAWVDDVNRIAEGNETDNKLAMPFQVATTPRVFAHWHHSAQRAVAGANGVAAYQLEIRKAKAMGIDGFAYNVINVGLELPEIENLYTAANLEGNFFLFPEADQCCGMTDAQIDQLAYFKYTDPARLRVDGGRYGNNLPVMQTWHGAAKGTTYWKSRQDAWAAAGRPMYFIPFFHPTNISVSTLFDNWDGTVAGQSDDLVDGLQNFSGWASLTDPHAATNLNRQYDAAADSRPGMDAMTGCAPVFNRHSGPTEVENRIIGNFEGFTTWISCLQGLVADNPRFTAFSTWNDYLEGSYLGGPYPRDALWPNYRGNEFSHDAFREIAKYYLEWYKTGRQPQITTDLIAIAHRPHPMCAPGPHPGSDGSATCAAAANDTDNAEDRPYPYTPESTVIRPLQRQVGATAEDDMLYAAVILKAAGRVTLTSGTTTKVVDLPAGVSQVSMPFAVGLQSIKLERNGALVTSATSAVQIVARPNVFNYNVATAYARR